MDNLSLKDLPPKSWQRKEYEKGRVFGPPVDVHALAALEARVAEVEERKRLISAASGSVAAHEVLHVEIVHT